MNTFNRVPLKILTLFIGPLLFIGCGEDDPGDTYPDHAISMLVGFKMGGGADVFARKLAEAAKGTLNVDFSIENMPGDGGTLASTAMLGRAGDGYNIMVGNAGSMILAPTGGNLTNVRWDAFEPVARIHGEEEFLFVRTATAGATDSFDTVLAYARANPGMLKVVGSAKLGIDSFVFQFLQKTAQITGNYVEFSGGGEARKNFLDMGIGDVIIGNYSDLSEDLAAGRLTPIAVASEVASPIFPNVPTLKSKGFDVVLIQWRGVLAPKGTDAGHIKKLADGFKAALETDSWKAFRESSHSVDLFLGPTEYRTFLESEQRRYEALIDELHLRAM